MPPNTSILTIGHSVGTIDRTGAGVAAAVSGLCSHLAEQPGLDITLVSTTTDRGPQYPLSSAVRAVTCPAWSSRFLRLHVAPGFSAKLERGFSNPSVSLVHCHGLWMSVTHAACAHARRHNLPLIISTHGMLTPWALRHKAWKKRLAWRLFQERDIRGATLLHATSEQEAQGLREVGMKQPIAVIPNGLDLPAWQEPNNSKPPFRALFLGRIYPVKGLINLVDAWAQVRPEGWQCILAGPDEAGHQAEVAARIQQHGLGKVFSFTGPVDDEQKWTLYRQADLFILPSFTENFGLVVAEALACGIPAIATHGTPWACLESSLSVPAQVPLDNGARLTKAGWHVPVGVEPLAAALREATALPPEIRRKMGICGRRLVEERFGWPMVARQMHDTYVWILNQAPKPDCILPAQ